MFIGSIIWLEEEEEGLRVGSEIVGFTGNNKLLFVCRLAIKGTAAWSQFSSSSLSSCLLHMDFRNWTKVSKESMIIEMALLLRSW